MLDFPVDKFLRVLYFRFPPFTISLTAHIRPFHLIKTARARTPVMMIYITRAGTGALAAVRAAEPVKKKLGSTRAK